MTGQALEQGIVTEIKIQECLTKSRGDIFVAACLMRVTARELNNYIKACPDLQSFALAVGKVKSDPDYDKMSREQFETLTAELAMQYRLEGLQEIHKIATMPMPDESAAMMDVKLKAAVQLRGAPGAAQAQGNDNENLLRELNEAYINNAPRIREIRAVSVTFQDSAPD